MDSLHASIHMSVVAALGMWQPVMIVAIAISPLAGWVKAAMVIVHLVVVGLSVLVHRGGASISVIAGAVSVSLILDFALATSLDGVLVLAAVWLAHFTNLVPPLLLPRGWVDRFWSFVVGFVVQASIALVHPEWLWDLAMPAAVTGLVIRWAGRRAMVPLRELASLADSEHESMWRERGQLAVAAAAVDEAAEQARVLHDTAVNTLAAVAAGGSAVSDVEAVRNMCRRDVATLDDLVLGTGPVWMPALDPMLVSFGLTASRSGLDDDAIIEALHPDVAKALAGAVQEVLRNVAKHAPGAPLRISALYESGGLEIVVADQGPGFDGALVPGRGLAESVFARASSAGFEVEVSSAPGRGTTVRFLCPVTEEGSSAGRGSGDAASPADISAAVVADADAGPELGSDDFRATIGELQVRTSLLWAAAVVVVGIAIETVNRFGAFGPSYGITYAMLAVVAVVGFLAHRDHDELQPVTIVAAIVATPIAFVLALVGASLGSDDLVSWQCLGASVPLVILVSHLDDIWPALASGIGLVVAAVVAATVVAADDPQMAGLVMVGAVPALGAAVIWHQFVAALERIGIKVAMEQAEAVELRIERDQRHAAAAANRRWREAGIIRCRALLLGIAEGSSDPSSEATRDACAEEERYLRQVILLDPELYRSGHRLARTLSQARARDVRFAIRSGRVDVENDEVAESLGHFTDRVVGGSAPGSEVIASLFTSEGALRFAVVGPSTALASAAAGWATPPGWNARFQVIGRVGLFEAQRVEAGALVSPNGGEVGALP